MEKGQGLQEGDTLEIELERRYNR
ncbi:hypothetical protein HFP65_25915 [Bacillus sp. CB62A.1]